jgi:hypothetical protein
VDALAITTAVLTLALVLITANYAHSTRRMVEEMRSSREQSQRPVIGVDIELIAPMYGALRVRNVGVGPAFAVRLTVEFQFKKGQVDRRTIEAAILAPGAGPRIEPPLDGLMDALADEIARVNVTGTLRDSLGATHDVAASFEDIGGWWDRVKEAQPHMETEPIYELGRKIERSLRPIHDELKKLRRHLDGSRQREREYLEERRRERQPKSSPTRRRRWLSRLTNS